MVVESASEVWDYNVGILFGRLDLTLVTRLDVLQIICNCQRKVDFVLFNILVNTTWQSDIRIWIDEHL